MKAYLKKNPAEVGVIMDLYWSESGQKRLVVRFAYSWIDADIKDFELV